MGTPATEAKIAQYFQMVDERLEALPTLSEKVEFLQGQYDRWSENFKTFELYVRKSWTLPKWMAEADAQDFRITLLKIGQRMAKVNPPTVRPIDADLVA